MCTCLIAGRKATKTGKAILAANDDWEGCPGVLTHVAGVQHAPGEMQILTGGQQIPQVRETCGYVYTACDYAVGTLDRAWAGGMNDCGVAVAGTGVDAYRLLSWKQGDRKEQWTPDWKTEGYLLEPDDIPLLVLQRGTSARQAVRMIGDLINQYGLRPSYVEGASGSSAATFSIADCQEGWVLEVYPGRCWVAVRVPDDCVSVRVNAFGTHDADLTDYDNTMSSPGLAAYARERGLWDGDERHFDFAAAFGSATSPTEWGTEKDSMNLRRRWRAMYLVDGKEEPEETLRYLARPADRAVPPKEAQQAHGTEREKTALSLRESTREAEEQPAKTAGNERWKRSVEDMMTILSDVYDNTPYDLRNVPEAGPVHDPFADGMPDYALCRQYTLASFVTDYIGEKKEPLMWTAMGIPRLVPYIPVWVDIDKLPECCGKGNEVGSKAGEMSLYEEMKRFCLHVRRSYDQNAEAATKRKKAYHAYMLEKIREEASETEEKIREEVSETAENPEQPDHGRRNRTAADSAHIQSALKICRNIMAKEAEE
ncbi:MAG: C69 family dipeptidase [Eubacterium sp.]|nr:C69 family dipeptidase [Eubacterium sp.]